MMVRLALTLPPPGWLELLATELELGSDSDETLRLLELLAGILETALEEPPTMP